MREQRRGLDLEHGTLRPDAVLSQRRALLHVEKRALRDLFTRGAIDQPDPAPTLGGD